MSNDRGFGIHGLGEIALRCANLVEMTAFYEQVIGLKRLPGNRTPDIVFFDIAEGVAGHRAVLALFHTPDMVRCTGALHHIALSLPLAEQSAAMKWYDRIGQPYRVELFDWIGWRGLFTQDPEGNTVELVAYDASLVDAASARRNTGLSGSDISGR